MQHGVQIKIAPSILAADFAAMGEAARAAEVAGADALHVDVMDGRFVPEISFGRRMIEALRRHTSLAMDVHLMVANPELHAGPFIESGAAAVTVHVEPFGTADTLRAVLEAIRANGASAGVALKPATPAGALDGLWETIDSVLVMTVEPGYSGQTFKPEVLPKVAALATRAGHERRPVQIGVDGGVDERTIRACVAAGARYLVAGSSVYSARRSVAEGVEALRRAAA